MFGGLQGVRDRGAIEAAIARPYCGYYRSIAQKAAALVHSLAMNHGFIDGNKRTALFMMALLLRRSGYLLRAESERELDTAVKEMVLGVVEHRLDFDALVLWFRDRIIKDE